MRKTLSLPTCIALAGLLFFAGALTAGLRHWFQPLLEVTFINASGQNITDIQFSLTTGSQKSISSLGPIENTQTRTYYFFVAGEGGYRVDVTLADGRKLPSENGYVESGYSIKETITESSINSQFSMYGF